MSVLWVVPLRRAQSYRAPQLARDRTLRIAAPLAAVLEKFAAVQMIDVYVPTKDGRELSLTRYTQPEPELKLLLNKLKLTLPAQAPPKIAAAQAARATQINRHVLQMLSAKHILSWPVGHAKQALARGATRSARVFTQASGGTFLHERALRIYQSSFGSMTCQT